MKPQDLAPSSVNGPASAPLSPRARPSRRARASAALALIGLIALTAWNLLRADALREARAAYPSRDDPRALRRTVQRALDHLDRHPGDPEAALLAARTLRRLEFYERAEPYYAIAQKAGRLDLDETRSRAEGLSKARKFEQAAPVYEEVLRRDPRDPVALLRLGGIRYGEKRYAEASSLGQRLAQIPSHEEEGQVLLATIYGEWLHFGQAADAFEKILELDPDLERISLPREIFWGDMAAAMLQVGRASDLRRHLTRALKEGEDALLLDLLGQAYGQESNGAEAERCWREAQRLDPKLPGPWKHLGIQLSAKDPKGALPLLERADELKPDDVEVLYNLGIVCSRLGLKERARASLKRADEIRARQKSTSGMGAGSGQSP